MLAPGLHASADAARLALEIEFSSARLVALAAAPPGLYGEAKQLAGSDIERASWVCFLLAYLSPAEDDAPFAGIEQVLALAPGPDELHEGLAETLSSVGKGPRSSHEPGIGTRTLQAYGQWVERSGGSQAVAFSGDPTWTPERRFERLFERLALPGLSRAARYELLLSMGRLGLYELRAGSLHLGGPKAGGAEDGATVAAKRVFGIGDPLLLDRRAGALAEASDVPIEGLDLALFNWLGPERATMGLAADATETAASGQVASALGV